MSAAQELCATCGLAIKPNQGPTRSQGVLWRHVEPLRTLRGPRPGHLAEPDPSWVGGDLGDYFTSMLGS